MSRSGYVCLALGAVVVALVLPTHFAAGPLELQGGGLLVVGSDGQLIGVCPLTRTAVKTEIHGPLAYVSVQQEFENTLRHPVEAIYAFPLPQMAAIHNMAMDIGDRRIRAVIQRREEAQSTYDAARQSGRTAALLDQERPNIFTHSVSGIQPGEKIVVTLEYVEAVEYRGGFYRWIFPSVVGPRYIPGSPVGKQGTGWSMDTTRVHDASRITPHVMPPGVQAGHDLSIDATLTLPFPLETIRSPLHDISVTNQETGSAKVRLTAGRTIPNRDFILEYSIKGQEVQEGVLSGGSKDEGFFSVVLQPPQVVQSDDVASRELIFVLDTSGSMEGFPLEKAVETMNMALSHLRPDDTFNVITFSGDTRVLFPRPVPAMPEAVSTVQTFLRNQRATGGTEMLKAIRAALVGSGSTERVRIVCFMTDGYVGNDYEILAEIQRQPEARVFVFGIGDSVNRFLLSSMAARGRGVAEFVTLASEADEAVQRFYRRIQSPVLTDIALNWNGLPVFDVTPARVPDLFGDQPVVVYGRYSQAARGDMVLTGKMAGQPYRKVISVALPEEPESHNAIAKLWARNRIEELNVSHANSAGLLEPDIEEMVTSLALKHRLITTYTSFVAVDDQVRHEGRQVLSVNVPVELPSGLTGNFGFGGPGLAASGEVTFDLVSMWHETSPWPTLAYLVGLSLVILGTVRLVRRLRGSRRN